MLDTSDFLIIAGIAASPATAIGLFVISSLRASRLKRDKQHEENKEALTSFKDTVADKLGLMGNRLTAVETSIEHLVAWRFPHEPH